MSATGDLDTNKHEGALALRALYIIAHAIVHADGIEEDREVRTVVELVREALGTPDFNEAFIIRQYREHADLQLELAEVQRLSEGYRRALMVCAMRIAHSDLRLTIDEQDKLHQVAGLLGLQEEDDTPAPEAGNLRAWAYAVLGLRPGASAKQVRQTIAQLRASGENAPEIDEAEAILLATSKSDPDS